MQQTEVKDQGKGLGPVIEVDESQIRGHLDQMLRGTVEEMLNKMLKEAADRICRA